MRTRRNPIGTRTGGAFTIFELLLAIAVIGLLIALLITGIRRITAFAKETRQRGVVTALRQAMGEFESEFRFSPPLIRGDSQDPGVPQIVADASGVNLVRVWRNDAAELRRPDLGLGTLTRPTPANPLIDHRYSTASLAYFLAGAPDTVSLLRNATSGPPLPPMDGVAGSGFFAPRNYGEYVAWQVPRLKIRTRGSEIDNWDPNAKVFRRAGRRYEAMVNLGKADPVLFVDAREPSVLELRDRKGAPYRLYRWLASPAPTQPDPTYAYLNVPPLVARDPTLSLASGVRTPESRDITRSVEVRAARWAIVCAGPDGVFGDEADAAELAAKVNLPFDAGGANALDQERKVRFTAEQDNIVEIGS